MAQRVTYHNSRKGDGGKVIRATHNEHEHQAEHIDSTKTEQNRRWLFQAVDVPEGEDFQNRYEQVVYEANFSDCLAARNAKAIKGRHKERVQSMEQFRLNARGCPEETLYYLGSRKDEVDSEVFVAVFNAYVEWHKQQFPNVLLLSAYMHLDEATPHIHERKVWTATEDGITIISQEKALTEMGIERPDPTKKVGRYNNAKMTYTAMCRTKLQELAREYGLEIIDEPKKASESGKTLLQHQYDDTVAELSKLQGEVEYNQNGLDCIQMEIMYANYELEDVRSEATQQALQATQAQARVNNLQEQEQALQSRVGGLQSKIQALTEETAEQSAEIDKLQAEKSVLLKVCPKPEPPKIPRPETWEDYLKHHAPCNRHGKPYKIGSRQYGKAVTQMRDQYDDDNANANAQWQMYDDAYAAWLTEVRQLGAVDLVIKAYKDKLSQLGDKEKALNDEKAALDNAKTELERRQAAFSAEKADFNGKVNAKAKELTERYSAIAEREHSFFLIEQDKNAELIGKLNELNEENKQLKAQLVQKKQRGR